MKKFLVGLRTFTIFFIWIGSGLSCIVLSILVAGAPLVDTPNCDGKPMQPGMVCVHYKNGIKDHENTYASQLEEDRANEKQAPYIGALIGIALAASGGWILYYVYIKKDPKKKQ